MTFGMWSYPADRYYHSWYDDAPSTGAACASGRTHPEQDEEIGMQIQVNTDHDVDGRPSWFSG